MDHTTSDHPSTGVTSDPGAPLWARGVALLAQVGALAAGAILLALIAVVVLSVAGRALLPLGLTSIRGDFELVSAGVAVAAFLSLGWVHLQDGHAVVDLLVERFPPALHRGVAAGVNGVVAVAAGFLCWRLVDGAADRFRYGDTSQLLGLPLGWPYALAAVGAGLFAFVALMVAVRGRR